MCEEREGGREKAGKGRTAQGGVSRDGKVDTVLSQTGWNSANESFTIPFTPKRKSNMLHDKEKLSLVKFTPLIL